MFSFDLAQGLATAKPTKGKGPYLDRGQGRVTIKSIQSGVMLFNKKTQQEEPTFVAKLQIESCSPLPEDEAPPHPVGTEIDWMQPENKQMGRNNALAFLMAATGNPQSDFSADLFLGADEKPIKAEGKVKPDGSPIYITKCDVLLNQVCGPDQALRGLVVDYRTFKTITKETKQVIHPATFSHVEQTGEQVAANRARLDQAAKAA